MLVNENNILPREKLENLGADSMSDAELLAVILRTGTKGHPVTEMSMDLLSHFNGSLVRLCDASVRELCEVPGMGRTKSLELCAAFALAKRMAMQRLAARPDMRMPKLIVNYMQTLIGNMQQEVFYVLMMDTQMRLMRAERITIGLVDRSLVHAREVFRSAIRESCSSIVLCHNHPSGSVKPSRADIDVTRELCKAGEIIGIRVIDHLIISNRSDDYYSFLTSGMLK